MTGIQILNELIKQRADAIRANQELVAWALSPDAFRALAAIPVGETHVLRGTFRRDVLEMDGVPAYLNAQQRSEIIPWRDEAMMRKETGIC